MNPALRVVPSVQRSHGGSRSGFSLVEVLLALALLAIALLGLTQALATTLRSTRESELHTAASLCAAGVIETLRAEGFLTDGQTEGDCGPGLEAYRWLQFIAPADLDGLHEVTVRVRHTQTGKDLFELHTLLFEAPLASAETDRDRRRDSSRRAQGGRDR